MLKFRSEGQRATGLIAPSIFGTRGQCCRAWALRSHLRLPIACSAGEWGPCLHSYLPEFHLFSVFLPFLGHPARVWLPSPQTPEAGG